MIFIQTTFTIFLSLFLLYVLVTSQVNGFIWENEISYVSEKELQRIPPLEETAEKLMTYFLARGPGKLSRRTKRQVPLWTKYFIYDVVFIVDASSSIDPEEFDRAKRGLVHLMSRAKKSTHYAAIAYANDAEIVFNFTKSSLAKRYIQTKVKHLEGLTNTQDALNLCRTQLLMNPSSGVRKRSYKRVMLVTDGMSNLYKQMTLWRALQLKFMGIEMYVLAVGNHIHGVREIASIATTPKSHLFRVKDFQSFVKVVKLIPSWRSLRDRYRKTQFKIPQNIFEA